MKSVKEKNVYLFEISKSKFYGVTLPVHSTDEVKDILLDLKNEYKDARHYCYAYIIGNQVKCSDDGEPSGTGGLPILSILKNNNLDHALLVVIRYFGGVKLGVGGLLRAYSNTAKMSVNTSNIVELNEGNLISIVFDYSETKAIDYLLKDINIIDKIFNDNVEYKFISNIDLSVLLKDHIISYKIIEKVLF
jgi:uncharacterized YigZ family protein